MKISTPPRKLTCKTFYSQMHKFCPKTHVKLLLFFTYSHTCPSGSEIRCLLLETPSLENKFMSYFHSILTSVQDTKSSDSILKTIYSDVRAACFEYVQKASGEEPKSEWIFGGNEDIPRAKFENSVQDCLLKWWPPNKAYKTRLSRTVHNSDAECVTRVLKGNVNFFLYIAHKIASLHGTSPTSFMKVLYSILCAFSSPPKSIWDTYESIATCSALSAFTLSRSYVQLCTRSVFPAQLIFIATDRHFSLQTSARSHRIPIAAICTPSFA